MCHSTFARYWQSVLEKWRAQEIVRNTTVQVSTVSSSKLQRPGAILRTTQILFATMGNVVARLHLQYCLYRSVVLMITVEVRELQKRDICGFLVL